MSPSSPSRYNPPVISNGAGRLFLPLSLLRKRRPAQREISLPLSWVPLDKSEGVVKGHFSSAVFPTPRSCQRGEDQSSGNVTANHLSVKPIVSPTIDTA